MNLHPPRLPFDPDGCLYGQQRIPARRVVQLIGTEQSCRAEGADTQDGLTVCVSVCRGGAVVCDRPKAGDEAVCLSAFVFGTAEAVWESHGCSWGRASAVWSSGPLEEGRAACVPSFA